MQILLERRGSMYDPLVVDTFVRVHKIIGPDASTSLPPPQVISAIAKGIATVQTDAPAHPAIVDDRSLRKASDLLVVAYQCSRSGR